jgi:conjugative transfer signal peptidase TraF
MTPSQTVLVLVAGLAAGVPLLPQQRPPPFVVNESGSVPRGLYRRTSEPVATGRLVTLALPPNARSYLAPLGAGSDARLLKRVAAVGGETVCSRDGRIDWDRGAVAVLRRDRHGRPLPAWRGCRRLAPDELFVVGDTPTSFDSRYFGPVRTNAVDGVYWEVWRW